MSTDPDNNSKAEKNTTPIGIQLHDSKILNIALLLLSYTAIWMTEIKYWDRSQNLAPWTFPFRTVHNIYSLKSKWAFQYLLILAFLRKLYQTLLSLCLRGTSRSFGKFRCMIKEWWWTAVASWRHILNTWHVHVDWGKSEVDTSISGQMRPWSTMHTLPASSLRVETRIRSGRLSAAI